MIGVERLRWWGVRMYLYSCIRVIVFRSRLPESALNNDSLISTCDQINGSNRLSDILISTPESDP